MSKKDQCIERSELERFTSLPSVDFYQFKDLLIVLSPISWLQLFSHKPWKYLLRATFTPKRHRMVLRVTEVVSNLAKLFSGYQVFQENFKITSEKIMLSLSAQQDFLWPLQSQNKRLLHIPLSPRKHERER